MHSPTLAPCPICNGDFVGIFKKTEIKYTNGPDKIRVWAACRNCGHRGISALERFEKEEDWIRAATLLWNNNEKR